MTRTRWLRLYIASPRVRYNTLHPKGPKECTLNKSEDPYYQILRDQYLKAVSVIHAYEVMQAFYRRELKLAELKGEISLHRHSIYRGRKTLSRLNGQIARYYRYCEAKRYRI